MALHNTLSIYKSVCELLFLATELTRNIPRAHKRQFSDQLINVCTGMAVRIRRANMAENKLPHLNQLLEDLEIAEVLIRLFKEQRWISIAQYSAVVLLTGSVGAQAGGWKKITATSPASTPSRRV